MIQRQADLEGFVREARLAEPLTPPLKTVEANYAIVVKLLPEAAAIHAEVGSLGPELRRVMESARAGYASRDRRAYQDASHALTTAIQYLTSITRAATKPDKEMDVAMQAMIAMQEARDTTNLVLFTCFLTGNLQHATALTQQLKELAALEEDAAEPVAVINRCRVLLTEARRIYRQIAPPDKQNKELEGLVSVGRYSAETLTGATKGIIEQ